jgi:hypothetical protein
MVLELTIWFIYPILMVLLPYKENNKMGIEKERLKQLEDGNYVNSNNEVLKDREFITMLVPRKEKWNRGDYVMGLQNSFIEIAKYGLNGEQLNTLMYLIGKTDFENYVNITQREISTELKIDQRQLKSLLTRK